MRKEGEGLQEEPCEQNPGVREPRSQQHSPQALPPQPNRRVPWETAQRPQHAGHTRGQHNPPPTPSSQAGAPKPAARTGRGRKPGGLR